MKHKARRRYVAVLAVCLVVASGVVYLYLTSGSTGIDTSVVKDYVATYHLPDTAAENAVTAVYLNYRFWDTLFEALILLISVLAIRLLSWNTRDENDLRSSPPGRK
jgi:multicomponent Na+:H+ antiporter subunit B